MPPIEITAKTKEEAIEEACDRLDLPEEALDIEFQEEEEDLLAGAKPLILAKVQVNLDYVADCVAETLEGLLEHMDIGEYSVSTETAPHMVIASIDNDQAEILIGYHGETLDAIQQLVVRMAHLGGREMPLILVDVAEYRGKRLNRLRRVCEDLAELAIENGQEEDFDPMDALDRKIVHTLLRDHEGVETYSRGEGRSRRVIIAPVS